VSGLHFGYNTNGFAHHRLEDALQILVDLGYDSVAITIDHAALAPNGASNRKQLPRVQKLLERFRLPPAIETGARFLLDPWRKHQPTLLSSKRVERQTRLDFLRDAVNLAARLNADVVSFWSGAPLEEAPAKTLMRRLRDGCRTLADHAAKKHVRLAFEPEPGMFIDSMERFAELFAAVDHPHFGLTIDIGHLHCQGEPIIASLQQWRNVLWNIHIEDMCRGVHEHLMFGDGEMDFAPILKTLREIGYRGGVHVELSRHSHNAVEIARQALDFLRRIS